MAERDDERLTSEVLAELQRDSFLRSMSLGLDVVTDNGIVTLTGSIDTEANRWMVEEAARRVVGVRDVRNLVTVMGAESSSRADDEIVREVMEEIARDPTIDSASQFHVQSRFGQLFITGTAESIEERDSVIAAARRVPGVEAIEDRIDVRVPVIGEERSPD